MKYYLSACQQSITDTLLQFFAANEIVGVIKACVVIQNPNRDSNLLITVNYRGCGKCERRGKGVTLVYLNTVIRWTRLTRQKSEWVDSLNLYDNTHIYACT